MAGRSGIYYLCLSAAIVAFAGQTRTAFSASAGSELVTLAYPNGAKIQVELADTNEKRARGLMFREQLANNRGMLFVFSEPGLWAFWMKNTKISLDILWLDQTKKIVDLAENIPGCVGEPCLQYQPTKDAMYALEIPAGSIKRLKLSKGMRLSFDLPKN
jgi:uncharacterized membrane protein (UPF0127 family)